MPCSAPVAILVVFFLDCCPLCLFLAFLGPHRKNSAKLPNRQKT